MSYGTNSSGSGSTQGPPGQNKPGTTGAIWPIEQLNAVTKAGRDLELSLHLDGARLWHATAATGISEADYAATFDSISVCFSKALGAPVGSCLVGGKDFIACARRFKQQIGGGFRQAGIIAAGALHALTHHRGRLAEVHALARCFADGLAEFERIILNPASIETNIVRFQLRDSDAGSFVEEAHRRGLHMLPSGPNAVRAVFYLDITEPDVEAALLIVRETLDARLPQGEGQAAASHVGTAAY